MKSAFYKTKLGAVCITEENGKIIRIALNVTLKDSSEQTPLLEEAARQLNAYLDGTLKHFTLPLGAKGTQFQQKVWKALCAIPYGKTATYGEIAAQIGNPKACRAVGMANNKNPIAIVVPCHRVIGAGRKLVGYAAGLRVKEKLLKLERDNK